MRVIDPLLVQLAATFHVTVGEASIAATVFLFANGVFRAGVRPVRRPLRHDAGGGHRLHRRRTLLRPERARGLAGLLTLARFLTGVTSSAIIPLAIAWVGGQCEL